MDEKYVYTYLIIGTLLFQNIWISKIDARATLNTSGKVKLVSKFKFNHMLNNSRKNKHPNLRAKRSKDMGWRLNAEDAKAVFKVYERCLINRNFEKANGVNTIKAILALEGQRVVMDCKLCQRPDQDPLKLQVDWQQLRKQDAVIRFVNPNDRIHIDHVSRRLTFESVDVTDAGQYFCINTYYREYEEIYQLDVLFRERRLMIKENENKTILKPFYLFDQNLKTFTVWSEWSDCNQCGKVGVRRKIGMCMVKKLYDDRPVKPQDLPILNLYPDGVPCRSTVLPKEIAEIGRIKYRRSETIMGKCYISCPTTPAFVQITDKNGEVIETIEAGYYSIKDKPTLPPMVKRRVIYEPTGKNLMLVCPTKSESKSIIRWQNGTTVLNPMTIRRQTRGRVRIDSINRLHIRALRLYDTAPYNCWLSKVHIATIKVIVTKSVNKNLKNYITYGGLLLTIVSVTLLCICTCLGKGKKTSK